MDTGAKPHYPPLIKPRVERQFLLRGQKALVTGGSRGIGSSIAVELGYAGADVVVNYHSNDEEAEAVVAEVKERCGVEAYAHQADVSSEGEVEEMFRRMEELFGGIDILIANAGLQSDAAIDDMTLEDWNKVIEVNLTGQFLCCREAIRRFKRRGVNSEISCAAGKIVCISSVHDIIPWAGRVNYAASKAGVLMMMKSMAQEVAPYRIRVNAISPGAIRTDINKDSWNTEEAYAALMKLIPYQRIGEPEDIGRAAVWLASDFSDYVTGTTIYVDGGMTLYPGFAAGG